MSSGNNISRNLQNVYRWTPGLTRLKPNIESLVLRQMLHFHFKVYEDQLKAGSPFDIADISNEDLPTYSLKTNDKIAHLTEWCHVILQEMISHGPVFIYNEETNIAHMITRFLDFVVYTRSSFRKSSNNNREFKNRYVIEGEVFWNNAKKQGNKPTSNILKSVSIQQICKFKIVPWVHGSYDVTMYNTMYTDNEKENFPLKTKNKQTISRTLEKNYQAAINAILGIWVLKQSPPRDLRILPIHNKNMPKLLNADTRQKYRNKVAKNKKV